MYGIALLDELQFFRRTAQILLKIQRKSSFAQYADKRMFYYDLLKKRLWAELSFSSLYLPNQT